jgi:hypothetical protein
MLFSRTYSSVNGRCYFQICAKARKGLGLEDIFPLPKPNGVRLNLLLVIVSRATSLVYHEQAPGKFHQASPLSRMYPYPPSKSITVCCLTPPLPANIYLQTSFCKGLEMALSFNLISHTVYASHLVPRASLGHIRGTSTGYHHDVRGRYHEV